MTKYSLKYGLIGGIIVAVFMLVNHSMLDPEQESSYTYAEWLGYAGMVIALSTIFFGVKLYRDQELDGFISWGHAFLTGLSIAVVASALYVVSWLLYSSFLFPDFMDQYFEYSVERVKQSGEDSAEIEKRIKEMMQFRESYERPMVKIGITFLEIFPVGLIVSIISALILRKSR